MLGRIDRKDEHQLKLIRDSYAKKTSAVLKAVARESVPQPLPVNASSFSKKPRTRYPLPTHPSAAAAATVSGPVR